MTIDIRDGQPQLSDLLDLMAAGDEVLIVEGDKQLEGLSLSRRPGQSA
jgi:antitoxin (DNA-binding transcriptional repressor) of toxin-antitoxin stability system